MGGKRIYNHKTLLPGTSVKVHAASPMEGTDHEWHGHEGVVLENGTWTRVRMEKRVRHWPSNDVLICNHNLRPITVPRT